MSRSRIPRQREFLVNRESFWKQDEAFLLAVVEERQRMTFFGQPTTLLVYADWLEEQGDPRGEYIRLQLEINGLVGRSPRDPERQANLPARRDELRSRIEQTRFTFWDKSVEGKLWFGLVFGSVTGVVTRIENYGFYVDLGGIEGLVHVSELPW